MNTNQKASAPEKDTAEKAARTIKLACLNFQRYMLCDSEQDRKDYLDNSPFESPIFTHTYLATTAILTKTEGQLAEFFGISKAAAADMQANATATLMTLIDAKLEKRAVVRRRHLMELVTAATAALTSGTDSDKQPDIPDRLTEHLDALAGKSPEAMVALLDAVIKEADAKQKATPAPKQEAKPVAARTDDEMPPELAQLLSSISKQITDSGGTLESMGVFKIDAQTGAVTPVSEAPVTRH